MKEVKLKSYDNTWYNPGGLPKRVLWYACNRLFIKTSIPFPTKFKIILLRAFGAKVGKGLIIKPGVSIKYPWFLEISDHVWIGENVWIDNLSSVFIGSNVCISQGAMLLCGNHNYKSPEFDLITKKITLEEGVWIGARGIVCPGVICRNHSVLGVGSVATSELESYRIYMGNPAKNIRERVIS
ncbi:WcaF family extracellular polysaccharide biosynthesis acetyltransferase [Robiginitalea sp. SC105]|uniref:WcaF family extracellular polysaccharide biosynthesis acetyltransferase n=1 Tax=Robiginitalea sp. SC105 TaxID=2762332 RepID=UPI00163B33AF|nr:WcaF family extracellular polysaccharide biosynthesis acetyltransferase [Robiginitalea sp. SC105]MBC2839274.1 colanic acid biosynthesis acetyltransferase WcaF [Robiginitalea sp. SC105]